MDSHTNRVYINPNFNRAPFQPRYASVPVSSNNSFYVNPYFSRNITNVEQNTYLNKKIYVNPHFIKTNKPLNNQSLKNTTAYHINSLGNATCSYNRYGNPNHSVTEQTISPEKSTPQLSSKSKYRLVRNSNKILETSRRILETRTIKISKYKSIPIRNFKINIHNDKNSPAQKYINKGSYKLIRGTTFMPSKSQIKANAIIIKRDMNLQSNFKNINGVKRKNNIPCRLFTKYGKCLRNLYGTCEYLHDKKHVSLCRKFIKGICHDKFCLLSHELSSKNMPTCYFYLKGMCTKDDCPYLHVKLNEKSKICHDFLKGYCDKGEKCLHRHVRKQKKYNVNKCNGESLKIYVSNKLTKYTAKLNKKNQPRKINTKIERKGDESTVINSCGNDLETINIDCRYFKDLQKEYTQCETLKPTRCKLGTLPSFIAVSK